MITFHDISNHLRSFLGRYNRNNQFIKYVIVGSTAFFTEYCLFLLLPHNTSSSLVVAQTMSFSAGLVISFLGNRTLTFKEGGQYKHAPRAQFMRYLLLAVVNIFLTNISITLLVKFGISASIAKLMVMVLVVAWNFVIFQKIIFRTN